MFFTVEKLVERVNELSKYRYRDTIPIEELHFILDKDERIGELPPKDCNWSSFRKGDVWKAHDVYAWLMAIVEIPDGWKERKVVGRFKFSAQQDPYDIIFEGLLFVNDIPFWGVDANHQEVILPDNIAGTNINLSFRLWSGINGRVHGLEVCEVSWLDEPSDDLYFSGKAIIETIKVLPEESVERFTLTSLMDSAFRSIDWSRPGSELFYSSIKAARSILHEGMLKIPKTDRISVHCIGQTHIDVAWLWQLKHTREKLARSFSTALRLMEIFPEFFFLQTQPQLYEYIKEDYPGIYEQIKSRIQERRWEAEGGMWLESDCNLPSGESLVRQLLFGSRFFLKEFGYECKYLWLPDVFGFTWALPQILKKSGINAFMTTKMNWNTYNRIPHDTFFWRGIDGSEVLTYLIMEPQNLEPGEAMHITPRKIQGIWNTYRDKHLNQDLLTIYGYGDGGGGVNRDMLEMRRRLNGIPGLPFVETGRADEYFTKLNERINENGQYVHTWDGELYLEFHRGTYTSQAHIKRTNRKLELLYRETEWLNIVSNMFEGQWSIYPQEELNEGWKIILRNQFHDIIPGTSIAQVYVDSCKEYERANALGQCAWEKAATSIIYEEDKNTAIVFNSSPWHRSDIVSFDAQICGEHPQWENSEGRKLLSQKSGSGWIVQVTDIPPMGFVQVQYRSTKTDSLDSTADSPFSILDYGIITPYYHIEWNRQGQLTMLYDKNAGRNVLSQNECGNVLQVFEDKPLVWNAWDIEIYYQEKMYIIEDIKSISVKEIGPLRAIIHFEWNYSDSSVTQDMIVYSDNRRIDFETEIDWHEHQQLLKTAFPVEIRSTEATYDIQFGNIKRHTHWNTSWDYARFETVGHQWADLSEGAYGISLLNDCKYGYDIKDNVMRLSLIKSGIFPDPNADQGKHLFTYSLLPHEGDWMINTVRKAWELNNPLTYKLGKPGKTFFSLFHISTPNIMIDAVKRAEDDDLVILRVHEFAGVRNSSVEITSDAIINWWQECNLMERAEGDKAMNSTIRFSIKPYEIKTFKISIKACLSY